MIGQRLAHYQIIEKLGEGGMGVVYKGVDTRLGRPVAIKVVNAEFTQRFEREARAISALNHPHICTLYDVGEHEGAPYLVMEYVEGKPLEGPMPAAQALTYAIQVAEALAAAHKAGIVHRDLKPDNILLTKDGGVKVLDFGLAKLQPGAAAGPESVTVTEQGVITGTASYMSPEQARGDAVDGRSDIFSLGAVLYELLSGRKAFRREGMVATLAAVMLTEAAPLKDAPAAVGRVVRKMLEKKREERYQSAEELLADLRAAATGAALMRRRLLLALAASIVLLLALAVGFDVRGLRTRLVAWMKVPSPSIRLAVLPFANLSGDPEQEYLSDGITQDMITQLGSLHPQSLSVIARASVMQYKKSQPSIVQVGRELKVDYVLEGSARREGGRIRITAELIRVQNQAQLWAESFERELAGILTLQSEVARKVAGALQLKLLPAEQARLSSARTVNPEAYDSCLKGFQLVNTVVRQDIDTGLEHFELALKKDPNYALAYAGIGYAWLCRNQLGYATPQEARPKAKAAALKAVELDAGLAQAHGVLANVHYFIDWDWAGAEAEYQKAMELHPNLADAWALYPHFLAVMKRPAEAIPLMQRVLELDPLNPAHQAWYAAVLEMSGRADEAIAQCRKTLKMTSGLAWVHGMLGTLLLRKGMNDESLAEMKASYAGDREMEEVLTQGYARGNIRATLKRAADLLAARARKTWVSPSDIALNYVLARETDQALTWLERGLEVHDPQMPENSAHLYFESLRNTLRFKAILRSMNLPE